MKKVICLLACLVCLTRCNILNKPNNNENPSCAHVDADHDHVCDLCHTTISQHSFGDWEVLKEATYDEDGSEHRICSVCSYEETRPISHLIEEDWTDSDKELFNEHLYGYVLPFLPSITLSFDANYDALFLEADVITLEEFNIYVTSLTSLGFYKENGPKQDSYILIKNIDTKDGVRTIDIDIFYSDGSMIALCYDPYIYLWPEEMVDSLLSDYFYVTPSIDVPSLDVERYYIDTSKMESRAILTIYCYSETNKEENYKESLLLEGYSVTNEKNEDGFFVATEAEELMDILFAYDSSSDAMIIVIKTHDRSWPAQTVDYYVNQLTNNSGTVVPSVVGADSYEFIDVFDRYGYFFVLCETGNNFESYYSEKLANCNYDVFDEKVNIAGNYFAISENEDLLIQYKYLVVESTMGNDDYTHFDVMYEKYYPHNVDHLNQGIEIICPGSETEVIEYPGYGEKIDFSDNDVYMTVTIQSSYEDSLQTYMSTLSEAGWITKTVNEQLYSYEAISPNIDIFMETSWVDGRITLTFSAYDQANLVWPENGINEILTTLDLVGEIPQFEGAYSYDYENNEIYHDVICLVKPGKEAELIQNYAEKLLGLDWVQIEDGDFVYFVKEGYTAALNIYTEYEGEGKVFINIFFGDLNIFDIDARAAFTDWKLAMHIVSEVNIPGINITNSIKSSSLAYDSGITYVGYDLFELIIELESGNTSDSISEITALFTSDGWNYSSSDSAFSKGSMLMKCYENDGKIYVDIYTERTMLSVMSEFLIKSNLSETISLPEATSISDSYSVEIDSYNYTYAYLDLSLYLTFSTSTKAANAKNAIIEDFKTAGWTIVSSGTTTVLFDKTETVKLEIYKSLNWVLVQFKNPDSY